MIEDGRRPLYSNRNNKSVFKRLRGAFNNSQGELDVHK